MTPALYLRPEIYATLPEELLLRELRVRVAQQGFRPKELVVVATLLDVEDYPANEIAELDRRRWQWIWQPAPMRVFPRITAEAATRHKGPTCAGPSMTT
jgi:hypothetical protein